MKSVTSIDQLHLQVQQTLFEYFYSHNKVQLEGLFLTPRKPLAPDCQVLSPASINTQKKEFSAHSLCKETSRKRKISKNRIKPKSDEILSASN